MPRTHPQEFRRKGPRPDRGGRTVLSISADFGVSGQTVYNWRNQDPEPSRGSGIEFRAVQDDRLDVLAEGLPSPGGRGQDPTQTSGGVSCLC